MSDEREGRADHEPQAGHQPPDDALAEPADADEAGEPTVSECDVCRTPLVGEYFCVNDIPVCENCAAERQAKETPGPLPWRLFKATLLGVFAALLGAAIYFFVSELTGYEFALVVLGMGYLVGLAVRVGSGFGGLVFQALALLLTYFSLGTAYTSITFAEYVRNPDAFRQPEHSSDEPETEQRPAPRTEPPAAESAAEDPPTGDTPDSDDPAAAAPPTDLNPSPSDAEAVVDEYVAAPESAVTDPASSQAAEHAILTANDPTIAEEDEELIVTTAQVVYWLGVLVVVLPVLVGFEHPMSFIFMAFAFYSAWRVNRQAPVAITGPFVPGDSPQ